LRRAAARIAIGALLLSACGPAAAGERQRADYCLVERVIDGDTLVCEGGQRVRLLLIDTPEMDQGEFGRLAREALLELLPPGTSSPMEFDVQRLDRYGRTLAYLYLPDGRMANLELARRGYAVVLSYPPNIRHIDEMRSAVVEAREARRGLWSGSAFQCEPVQHRRGDC
jgi:micrococcal nuclease